MASPPARASLDAARRPFRATGLQVPWYSVYGNHDNQLQGTIPASAELEDVATGDIKLISPPPKPSTRATSCNAWRTAT